MSPLEEPLIATRQQVAELPMPEKQQHQQEGVGTRPTRCTSISGAAKRCSNMRLFWRCVALPALVLAAVASLFLLDARSPLSSASTRDVRGALRALMFDTAVLYTGSNMTAKEALQHVVPKASALLVVTLGPNKPTRRLDSTPFLTVGPDVPLPTGGINVAASALEEVLGRHLFALHVRTVDMPASFTEQQGLLAGLNPAPRVPPVAIWEVGSGLVLVDRRLVTGSAFWGDAKVQHMFDAMGSQLFTALSGALRVSLASASAASSSSSLSGAAASSASSSGSSSRSWSAVWTWRHEDLPSLMGPALALAVSAAFATAPPLWFCVMCPAVLGLLAPLLINIGLNQLAGWLCVHLALPDDQCFDLLLGALGLGFVLALASAIPIFFLCRLQDCASGGGVQRLLLTPPGGSGWFGWLGGGGRKLWGSMLVAPGGSASSK